MKYLNYLLVLVPLTIILEILRTAGILAVNEIALFIISGLGIIPLASLMSEATEQLSLHAGPKIGGLLNATFGNAAELIITIAALQKGLNDLVKASITGSIIGNLLLVLGLSILLGGLKFGTQRFSRQITGTNASMMALALIGLFIPAIFEHSVVTQPSDVRVLTTEEVSMGVAVILILLYIASILYSFISEDKVVHSWDKDEARVPSPVLPVLSAGTNTGGDERQEDGQNEVLPTALPTEELAAHPEEHMHTETPEWSVRRSVAMLAGATVFIAIMSEILTGVVEPVIKTLGISEMFLGLIIIPLVGNVAENVVAIKVALKNKMDLSLAISLGSSRQIALLVAPLLIFVSLFASSGEKMNLVFTEFELAAVGVTVFISTLISLDGESNWLEGLELLAVYIILAIAFFFVPI